MTASASPLQAGLKLLGEVLPEQRGRLARLAREAPAFADLVCDYADARAALARLELDSAEGCEARAAEYRTLMIELEDEVRRKLGHSLADDDRRD
jgi:hypothetical protein